MSRGEGTLNLDYHEFVIRALGLLKFLFILN